MALSLNGVRLFGLTMSSDNAPPPNAGVFVQAFSSVAPPGPPIMPSGVAFSQTSPPPGPYQWHDPFDTETGLPNLDGRLINGVDGGTTVTIPLFNPTGYVWSDSGNTNPAGAGTATVTTGTFPGSSVGNQEFDMPTGIFFEYSYTTPTKDTAFIIGINLGDTSLSVVTGPDGGISPDGSGNYPARLNAGGFNGYTGSGGYNYADGSYSALELLNGSGGGASADITVVNGSVTSATLVDGGNFYVVGDIVGLNNGAVAGGTGSNFGIFVDAVDGGGVITALGAITNGTPLQANPLDMWDTASASFSTDAYYTTTYMDWRNVVIRAELTATTMSIYADGVLMMQQPLRFAAQLFASNAFLKGTANYPWSSGAASIQMFVSEVVGDATVDYVTVGAL